MKKRGFRPSVDQLEERKLMYATSGNFWPEPSHVTISFMPDGTTLGTGLTSNLQSDMNGITGLSGGVWETEILRAAQQWAILAHINLAVVPDDGLGWGDGNYQQGDPAHGDIRIGGYDASSYGATWLAEAMQPPPVNNFDLAGDILFNTGVTWHNGSTYDLYTVAMHEIGHALGMDHSSSTTAVMYAAYNGIKSGLTSDDQSGIQSIYAARPNNEYKANGVGTSSSNAVDLTNELDGNGLLTKVESQEWTYETDYYKYTVPAVTDGTATVRLQSDQYGLGSYELDLYKLVGGTWTLEDSEAMPSAAYTGGTVTASCSVVSGDHIMFEVSQTDHASNGEYKFTIINNASYPSAATLPLANGYPITGGGGEALIPAGHEHVKGGHTSSVLHPPKGYLVDTYGPSVLPKGPAHHYHKPRGVHAM
jgi:hypothetical protein